MRLDNALIWLHVTCNLFWIGSIAAVAVVLLGSAGDDKLRGEVASRIYRLIAAPAFGLSFLTGLGRLMMESSLYLKQPWMHSKLLFALIAIAVHHVIGGRAKRLARGEADGPGPTKVMFIVFAVCAALAAFFVIMQVPARG
jgi:putative membrane protein